MIKIAEIYKAAQSGSERDLDFIQKTAAIFGETATENFLRENMGYEPIKLASFGEPCIGFENVVKAAQAGSEVDVDYIYKLAEVIGDEAVLKLAGIKKIEGAGSTEDKKDIKPIPEPKIKEPSNFKEVLENAKPAEMIKKPDGTLKQVLKK